MQCLCMLGNTHSVVISESKKRFVPLPNKLFTAGDILALLSGFLIAEASQLQFSIQLSSDPRTFTVETQVKT